MNAGATDCLEPATLERLARGGDGPLQLSPEEASSVAAYRAAASPHDELFDEGGRIRPAWRALFAGGGAPFDWTAAARELDSLSEESGVAFNVYADPDKASHEAWQAGVTPVLFGLEEWALIERGCAQRARAIEAALKDLHGDRSLIAKGVVPAAALFGAVAFAPGLADWPLKDRRFLFSFALDLARSGDGRWRVLADHTDAPAGHGSALAIRLATSQALGERFFDAGVTRLSAFAEFEQERLASIAGDEGEVALLTPSPNAPDYFGHAFHARHASIAAVEPGDLTVRAQKLYAKTVGGLQRIDVLLRKAPARGLDPLVLGGGVVGAPGLAGAARKGNVRLCNDLAAGLADYRGLAPFMAALIRETLGEDPIFDDAPCDWLGAPQGRQRYVEEREWLRLSPVTGADGRWGGAVEERFRCETPDALMARLAREGHRWVALEPFRFASAPVFRDGCFRPRPFAMRIFCVVDGGAIQVMPGGFARISEREKGVALPSGLAKDVWVVGGVRNVQPPPILSQHQAQAHLRRTGRDLLSRIADALFWLGRYVERAETTLRILRTLSHGWLEGGAGRFDPGLARSLATAALDVGDKPAALQGAAAKGWLGEVAGRLLWDPSEAMGFGHSVQGAYGNAMAARAQIGQDAWRALNELANDDGWRNEDMEPQQLHAMADLGIQRLQAFAGATAETITRAYAWRFLEMGRRLERGVRASRLLGALTIAPAEDESRRLRALLDLSDAYVTYRTRYVMTPVAPAVLDLLALDETNPRAIAYQFKALQDLLAGVAEPLARPRPEERLVLKSLTDFRLAEIDALSEIDAETGEREKLRAVLAEARRNLSALSDRLSEVYFAHAERDEPPSSLELTVAS